MAPTETATTFDDLIAEVSEDVKPEDVAEAQRTADFLAENPVAFAPVRMFAIDEPKQ